VEKPAVPTSLVPQVGQSFLAHTTAQAPLSLAFTDFLAQRRSVTLIAVLIKIKMFLCVMVMTSAPSDGFLTKYLSNNTYQWNKR
jgi:hypothetical protein